MNCLPSSLLLSREINKSILSSSLLNAAEAFFHLAPNISPSFLITSTCSRHYSGYHFFHSHLRNASILGNSTIKICFGDHSHSQLRLSLFITPLLEYVLCNFTLPLLYKWLYNFLQIQSVIIKILILYCFICF